jgi:pantetheine-phosphate adenylyltransferase
MKRAVFPGSFDPITLGHEDIVIRGTELFDEIIVAIGVNSAKNSMYSLEMRKQMLEDTFKYLPQVKIETFEGLTVDYCKQVEANWLLRGVRNANDYSYESTIAQMNKLQNNGLDTCILFTDPEFAPVSSTVIRDILQNGGDVSEFVPQAILQHL